MDKFMNGFIFPVTNFLWVIDYPIRVLTTPKKPYKRTLESFSIGTNGDGTYPDVYSPHFARIINEIKDKKHIKEIMDMEYHDKIPPFFKC